MSKRTCFCFNAAFVHKALKGANYVEFNFLKEMMPITCIVASDTILSQKHCCRALIILRYVDSDI